VNIDGKLLGSFERALYTHSVYSQAASSEPDVEFTWRDAMAIMSWGMRAAGIKLEELINALEDGKFEEGDKSKRQDGDGGGQTAEAGRCDSDVQGR